MAEINVHKSTSGIGYKIKFPNRGPYDAWRLTLRGARRCARRKMACYNRCQQRKQTVVSRIELD